MLNSSRFIDERLSVSITSFEKPNNPVDANSPLTFQEWLKYNTNLFTNADDFLNRYQSYLNNWYEVKNLSKKDQVDTSKSLYTSLINEIVLSFTSFEEKRFLKNLDYNNNRDLAIAIPFFAKKIKDICLYYSTLRDDTKSATTRYNLKGSNFGIGKLIYNEIAKSLETDDLTELTRTLNLDLSALKNNLIIDVEDLYDTYTNYLDVSPNKPASAYDIFTGERNELFNFNQYDIDPTLFLNFNQSIVNAISSYPFFLLELGSNNFSIDPQLNSSQLNYLKDSDFINTVNTEAQENLNLNLIKTGVEKFIGTDFYYVSTGSTSSEILSGVLFTANNDFANYLNKRYPSVAAVPSTEYIKTAKEIGLFFKPDKIGLSVFNNFGLRYKVDTTKLKENTVYIFPDPKKYGNVSGLTEEEFFTPIDFYELSYFLKTDFSNQYKFGDPITHSYYQTFRGYESRDQTLNTAVQGVIRYTDPQEFFKTDIRNIWANTDIYPAIPQNELPIDLRAEKLLSKFKTVVQYKNDIYGNEYILFKDVNPQKALTNVRSDGDLDILKCLALDGHLFFDPISGFKFNYDVVNDNLGYSGVTFKTTLNIPPGSGYYANPATYNLGIPRFFLSGSIDPVISYRMQPETFCDEIIKDEYLCSEFDGTTFVSADSTLLVDFPSDSPDFASDIVVYYSILVDAGATPYDVNYKPSFVNPAIFTFVPPYSAVGQVNGYVYTINGVSPCANELDFNVSYIEENNFLNYKVPLRETTVIEGITGLDKKKSLFDSKFIELGDMYYRNSNSSIILPLSTALSGVIARYSENVANEINNSIINFDVVYDVIQFETINYLAFVKIQFDYDTNQIKNVVANDSYFYKGLYSNFEKFSTVWFNEAENNFIFCKTVIFYDLSATNYKMIYPEIYSLDVDTLKTTKLYPLIDTDKLTYYDLKDFSLLEKNINVNIVEIEKPLLNFDNETGTYCISYLGKDISEIFYIFKTYFKYINGKITNINNSMYKLVTDVNSTNFSNFASVVSGEFLDKNIFTFNGYAPPGELDTQKGVFIFKPYS